MDAKDFKKEHFALRLTVEQNRKVIDYYKKIIEEKDKQIAYLQEQIKSIHEANAYKDLIVNRQESIIHGYCIIKTFDF